MRKQEDYFEYDGRRYKLMQPLPIADKKKRHRKNMFEKDYITPELVFTCIFLGSLFGGLIYTLINMMS